MGIESLAPKPRTTIPIEGHRVYPYLLRNLEIVRPDQVGCCDITYIPMQLGFFYLVAVMDWFSRYVISWRLSNNMEVDFCVEALENSQIRGGLSQGIRHRSRLLKRAWRVPELLRTSTPSLGTRPKNTLGSLPSQSIKEDEFFYLNPARRWSNNWGPLQAPRSSTLFTP